MDIFPFSLEAISLGINLQIGIIIYRFAVSVQWERQEEEEQGRPKPFCTGSSEDFYRCCCCCARRVGNMFFLWERRDGSPIVVAGPCWPFCVFVTLPLILILSALVAYFVFFADIDGMRRLVRPSNLYIRWTLLSFFLQNLLFDFSYII